MKVLEVRMNCKRTRISEAKGLKQKGYGKGGEQTLKEFLREQGGVDEEQERIVTEAQKRREDSNQAK